MRRAKGKALLAEISAIDWLVQTLADFNVPEGPYAEDDFYKWFDAHMDASPFGEDVHPEALMQVLWQVSLPQNKGEFHTLLAQLQAMAVSRRRAAAKWRVF